MGEGFDVRSKCRKKDRLCDKKKQCNCHIHEEKQPVK
jgi:hypothetical protein